VHTFWVPLTNIQNRRCLEMHDNKIQNVDFLHSGILCFPVSTDIKSAL
jgi:hypothetical protein